MNNRKINLSYTFFSVKFYFEIESTNKNILKLSLDLKPKNIENFSRFKIAFKSLIFLVL